MSKVESDRTRLLVQQLTLIKIKFKTLAEEMMYQLNQTEVVHTHAASSSLEYGSLSNL